MTDPLVSIVIPTFNSEEFLEQCLKSIRTQNHRNTEIILVDNCSRDKTELIGKKYGALFVNVRAKRSEARNIGARSSKGKMLLFLDSDMELASNVISACVKKAKRGYDAIIIPEISVGEGFWSRCRALEKVCYLGDDLIEAARFFPKTTFENIHGFDPALEACEDWDLTSRTKMAGYRIGRIQEFARHHEGILSLKEAMSKKRWYGKTAWLYKKKHPTEAKHQLGLVRPALIKNWRKLATDPIHATGLLFLKSCEFNAMELGRLAIIL